MKNKFSVLSSQFSVLFLAVVCLAFSGCAQHDFELANGKRGTHGKIQSNGTNITIRATPKSYYFHADTLDNSTATMAGVKAIDAVGNGLTKLGTAAVAKGFVPIK